MLIQIHVLLNHGDYIPRHDVINIQVDLYNNLCTQELNTNQYIEYVMDVKSYPVSECYCQT